MLTGTVGRGRFLRRAHFGRSVGKDIMCFLRSLHKPACRTFCQVPGCGHGRGGVQAVCLFLSTACVPGATESSRSLPARSSQPGGLRADTEPVPPIAAKRLLCTEPRAAGLTCSHLAASPGWGPPLLSCYRCGNREVKKLGQGHTAKGGRVGSEPRQLAPRYVVLISDPHGPLVSAW